ncbi:hypothetical protein C273_05090 [Staphylococcus massiliensis S46]|uniref:Uncharacterized protein n=1 Tax=Staphylococcus massiliensis S46 TaxID=1229783 RepID=K9AMM1_9STAP|nr:hypothetical protein C273_05090 [Staphylococcus massiliensis S46]
MIKNTNQNGVKIVMMLNDRIMTIVPTKAGCLSFWYKATLYLDGAFERNKIMAPNIKMAGAKYGSDI